MSFKTLANLAEEKLPEELWRKYDTALPQEWVDEMIKMAEENIRSCLRTIIIFDDIVEGDSIDAVLVDSVEE